MTDGQYHFLLNTRMEKFSDYAMVYTCVANKVQGYFRLRWHIPGHYFESNVPEANELPRPVGIGDAIALRNGCYAYGNLAKPDRSTFYSSGLETARAEEEQKHPCLQTFAEGYMPAMPRVNSTDPPPVMLLPLKREESPSSPLREPSRSAPTLIPKKISYSYVASFFTDPRRDTGTDPTSISFYVNFDGQANTLVVGYKLVSSAMPAGLMLMPVSSAPDDLAERSLSELFKQRFVPPDCKEQDKFNFGTVTQRPFTNNRMDFCNQKTFGYPMVSPSQEVSFTFEPRPDPHFGSVQLNILGLRDPILSAFWVPVLY